MKNLEDKMKIIEQLKIMASTTYKDFEGDDFQIKLKKGLTNDEINALKNRIQNGILKQGIIEVLQFSRGFDIPNGFLGEIRFDEFGFFGFEELLGFCLTITHDWAGNYWVQEINKKGEWGRIYYVCHDPAVIVKQADSLYEFLIQMHEYLLKEEASFLSKVIDEISFKIYEGNGRLLEQKEAIISGDELLSNFASNYNEDWFIADLRHAKNGEGFRLEAMYKETIRLEDELIWALKKYKSFWTKLREWFR